MRFLKSLSKRWRWFRLYWRLPSVRFVQQNRAFAAGTVYKAATGTPCRLVPLENYAAAQVFLNGEPTFTAVSYEALTRALWQGPAAVTALIDNPPLEFEHSANFTRPSDAERRAGPTVYPAFKAQLKPR